MYRIAIDEAKGSAFYVSQFVLEDPAMAHDYNGLDYMVQRSKVTISPKGEIKVKQLNTSNIFKMKSYVLILHWNSGIF